MPRGETRRTTRTTSWLMVEGHLDQIEQLTQAGVTATRVEIVKPWPVEGLTFPATERDRALEILGLSESDVVLAELETDRPGVLLLNPELGSGADVILERPENMAGWSSIEPVLRKFASRLGKCLVVSSPHSDPVPPLTEPGKIYIRFWATPVRTAETKIPTAFGIPLENNQCDASTPSGEGLLITDQDGTAVAEYVGGTLYVLFDLPHFQGNRNNARLMQLIMEEFCNLLEKSPNEIKEMRKAVAERIREKSRQEFVDVCLQGMVRAAEQSRAKIAELESALHEYQQRIVAIVRDIANRHRRIMYDQTDQEEIKVKLADEFDHLGAISGIKEVTAKDGRVSAFTNMIEIPFEGRIYTIGCFRIDIYPSGEGGGIHCFNLTTRLDNGYADHPHIKESRVCWGNIADGIAKMVGDYQFTALIQVILQFLETYNPESPYYKINLWPSRLAETASGEEVRG